MESEVISSLSVESASNLQVEAQQLRFVALASMRDAILAEHIFHRIDPTDLLEKRQLDVSILSIVRVYFCQCSTDITRHLSPDGHG